MEEAVQGIMAGGLVVVVLMFIVAMFTPPRF